MVVLVHINYQEQFNIAQLGLILNGQRPQYTTNPAVLPAGLTWETSTTKNIGLDFAMLSNRLQFVGDAYIRETTDMFTTAVTPPAVFGATAPSGNYADLETKGWEMTLSWHDNFQVAKKPFNYDVRLTLADNSAKITKYNNPEKRLTDYYEGQTIGEIWGYVTEGFFTSADDVTKHANQKLFLSTSSGQTFPGDIKLKDINKDNVINPGTGTVDNPGDRVSSETVPQDICMASILAPSGITFSSPHFSRGLANRIGCPARKPVFSGDNTTGPIINYQDGI